MRKPLIAIVWLIVPLCACARMQTFRVVDAQTGLPVHGAQAERFADVARSTNPSKPEALSLPVEVSATNIGGVASFQGTGQQFALKKEGYDGVQIRSTLSGIRVRYDSTGEEVPAQMVEGMASIPMRRVGSTAPVATTIPTTATLQSGVTPVSATTATAKSATAPRSTVPVNNAVGSTLK